MKSLKWVEVRYGEEECVLLKEVDWLRRSKTNSRSDLNRSYPNITKDTFCTRGLEILCFEVDFNLWKSQKKASSKKPDHVNFNQPWICVSKLRAWTGFQESIYLSSHLSIPSPNRHPGWRTNIGSAYNTSTTYMIYKKTPLQSSTSS